MAQTPEYTALLLENVHPDADNALQTAGPVTVKRLSGSPDRAQLESEIASASVLGIRSRTHVDAALLDAAKELQAAYEGVAAKVETKADTDDIRTQLGEEEDRHHAQPDERDATADARRDRQVLGRLRVEV